MISNTGHSEIDKLLAPFSDQIRGCELTGSSVICCPPVDNTDIDILILCEDQSKLANALISIGGCTYNCKQYTGIEFINLKVTCTNFDLIVTSSEKLYNAFTFYTQLATLLNVRKKHERVALCELLCKLWSDDLRLHITKDGEFTVCTKKLKHLQLA